MRILKDSHIEWIGKIPENWNIIKGKYILRCLHKPIKKDDGVITCFRNGEVTLRSNRREDGFTLSDKEIGYQGIDVGDLVVHGMDGFAGAIGVSDSRGKASPVLNVLETNMNKKYIMYYLRTMAYGNVFLALSTGIRVRSCDLSWNKLAELPYPIPPLKEQGIIVEDMEYKLNEIDSLLDDIHNQVIVLEEYKKSIIYEAVTKGINSYIEMKDSGLSWVKKIPNHWNVYRIADLYEDRNERGDDTLPLLTVSINTGVSDKEIDDLEKNRVFVRSEDKTKYKHVFPGDLTYNMMRAWQGGMGAVRVEGMVSPAYVVAKPKGKIEIDSRFIEAILRCPLGIEEMNRYSYGIMDFRKRLYWPQFRLIKVALPDIREQRMIADYIDCKTKDIDSIIEIKMKQIDEVLKYKKSLIYEYVTGKKC